MSETIILTSSHGRPLELQHIRQPDYGSSAASQRTVRERRLPTPTRNLLTVSCEQGRKPKKRRCRRLKARIRRRQRRGRRGLKRFVQAIHKPLDDTNTTVSAECRICERKPTAASAPHQDLQRITAEKTYMSTAHIVHGGDWQYLSAVFGTTGPNGKHFCNQCLVTLGDLEKGQPHAPF